MTRVDDALFAAVSDVCFEGVPPFIPGFDECRPSLRASRPARLNDYSAVMTLTDVCSSSIVSTCRRAIRHRIRTRDADSSG